MGKVEEFIAAKLRVAIHLARIYIGDVDGDVYTGLGGGLVVQGCRSAHFGE